MDFNEFKLDDKDLFAALMENMADSIYFKDRECRLIRVSRKMAQDLGYNDPAEIIGKTDIDLFGEEFGRKNSVRRFAGHGKRYSDDWSGGGYTKK